MSRSAAGVANQFATRYLPRLAPPLQIGTATIRRGLRPELRADGDTDDLMALALSPSKPVVVFCGGKVWLAKISGALHSPRPAIRFIPSLWYSLGWGVAFEADAVPRPRSWKGF